MTKIFITPDLIKDVKKNTRSEEEFQETMVHTILEEIRVELEDINYSEMDENEQVIIDVSIDLY